MTTPTDIVQKLSNYCSIHRDDGLSYGDYVELLSFLLFLKMADEQARSPLASAEKRRDAAATVPLPFCNSGRSFAALKPIW